jgi:hypothetical protein
MTPEEQALLSRIAASVAGRMARRNRWVERRDLQQEALQDMTRALQLYNPEVGPLEPYLWRTARIAAQDLLMRTCTPLSARSTEYPALWRLVILPEEDAFDVPEEAPPADVLVGEAEWYAEVRTHLDAALGGMGEDAALARAVLLMGGKSEDVATLYGVPRARVYRATGMAKQRIAQDLDLWRLWKERG